MNYTTIYFVQMRDDDGPVKIGQTTDTHMETT